MAKKPGTTKGKETTVTVKVEIPDGKKVSKMSIHPNGDFVFLDDEGNEFVPKLMTRDVVHTRQKGPKIRTRASTINTLQTVGGLSELSEFDSIIVIDTNTRTVNGQSVSVPAFINVKIVPEEDAFRLLCIEGRVNFYEFRGVSEKAELVAISKVVGDIASSADFMNVARIAIVTDTELGHHTDFNSGQTPIFGNFFLPRQFRLLYASADTGQEILNKLIRFVDAKSTEFVRHLENRSLDEKPFSEMDGFEGVRYRFYSQPGLEIDNPTIKPAKLQAGTKVSLFGIKNKQS